MIARLDRVGVFLSIFTIVNTFGAPFWGVFWDKNVHKWSMEKEAKNKSDIFMQVIPALAHVVP